MIDLENPLFEKWPELLGQIPHVDLGLWPTPIEQLEGLTDRDGSVWVKREDLSSPFYGGNKVRKLEFLLADSEKTVLTFGAFGSHHVLATAIHARRVGRSCIGFLVPEPTTEHHLKVGQLVRQHCVATIPLTLKRSSGSSGQKLRRILNLLLKDGVTMIAPGASSPRGTLGFVAAGIELGQQVKKGLCPAPARIYVPLGTGGTAAGLALGLAIMDVKTEIRAVRVASAATGNGIFLRRLAHATHGMLRKKGIPTAMPRLNISVEHRYIGPGYGHITQDAARAVQRGADLGLSLETTYTGKTLAALIADRKSGAIKGPTMLLNTYGPIEKINERATGDGEKST